MRGTKTSSFQTLADEIETSGVASGEPASEWWRKVLSLRLFDAIEQMDAEESGDDERIASANAKMEAWDRWAASVNEEEE